MNKNNGSTRRWYGVWFLAMALLLGVTFIVWWTVGHWPVNNQVPGQDFRDAKGDIDLQSVSAFGDSFGYINALFSGLAFGGVILTIIMQTMELRLQRQEIQGQSDVLRQTLRVHALSSQVQAWAAVLASGDERAIRIPGGQQAFNRRDLEYMFIDAVQALRAICDPKELIKERPGGEAAGE